MKFLLIVLVIHFIGELITSKRKNTAGKNDEKKEMRSIHPAEYELR
jgi:hypothetical protein